MASHTVMIIILWLGDYLLHRHLLNQASHHFIRVNRLQRAYVSFDMITGSYATLLMPVMVC
jgi:hypothetical protein